MSYKTSFTTYQEKKQKLFSNREDFHIEVDWTKVKKLLDEQSNRKQRASTRKIKQEVW